MYAGVAELAVMCRARPVGEEARTQKAPRSKLACASSSKQVLGTARVPRRVKQRLYRASAQGW